MVYIICSFVLIVCVALCLWLGSKVMRGVSDILFFEYYNIKDIVIFDMCMVARDHFFLISITFYAFI